MKVSKLELFSTTLDGLSVAEQNAIRKMVIDTFGATELAVYLINNWGNQAANKVSDEIYKLANCRSNN
jgi:hypothetical protein